MIDFRQIFRKKHEFLRHFDVMEVLINQKHQIDKGLHEVKMSQQ
jgi:hypothetical protein